MFSGFSRRQLLRLIAGLVAGAAAVGSIPFLGKLFVSGAQAQNDGVVEEKYKGRTFRIVPKKEVATFSRAREVDQPVELYIDGTPVGLLRDKESGTYQTYLLFEDFKSPTAVAKELIDLGVVIPTDQREE